MGVFKGTAAGICEPSFSSNTIGPNNVIYRTPPQALSFWVGYLFCGGKPHQTWVLSTGRNKPKQVSGVGQDSRQRREEGGKGRKGKKTEQRKIGHKCNSSIMPWPPNSPPAATPVHPFSQLYFRKSSHSTPTVPTRIRRVKLARSVCYPYSFNQFI